MGHINPPPPTLHSELPKENGRKEYSATFLYFQTFAEEIRTISLNYISFILLLYCTCTVSSTNISTIFLQFLNLWEFKVTFRNYSNNFCGSIQYPSVVSARRTCKIDIIELCFLFLFQSMMAPTFF